MSDAAKSEIPPLGLATGSAIRFPNPPRFTERDDTPAEYALEVSDGVPGGCVVHGLYTKYRDKPEWVTNCSSRALIRMLLAQADAAESDSLDAIARSVELNKANEKLRAVNQRLERKLAVAIESLKRTWHDLNPDAPAPDFDVVLDSLVEFHEGECVSLQSVIDKLDPIASGKGFEIERNEPK